MALLALVASTHLALATDSSHPLYKRQHDLLAWIDGHTNYTVKGIGTPVYVFKSQAALDAMYCGGQCLQDPNVIALHSQGVIFLSDDFALPRDDYVLLHELVHFVQHENGAAFDCRADQEREAYELQIKWADETGAGETPSGLWMLMLSCKGIW